MVEFLFEVLFHLLLRTALGVFVGFPTFCGTLVYRLARGASISDSLQAAWKNTAYAFAVCLD